jgi:Dolichyl-phosphate-mannose-protein mannosyltransferase
MLAQSPVKSACPWTAVAAVLLVLQTVLICSIIPTWSATRNEASHIVAGLTYWIRREFGLYNVNPPLPRMVATVLLLGDDDLCLDAVALYDARDKGRQEFQLGQFFADTNALWFHQILCRARLVGILWAFVGGLIVWAWASDISGSRAGALAVGMWVTEPTLCAHASLVTCDFPATVAGFGATYCFYRSLRDGRRLTVVLSGVLLGIALLCKFTIAIFIPAWLLAWTYCRLSHRSMTLRARPPNVRQLFVCASVVCLTVNSGYCFRNVLRPLAAFQFKSNLFSTWLGTLQETAAGNLVSPVPQAYLEGIDVQEADFERGLPSYLIGERRTRGWWYYYICAFCVKSPIGHLLLYLLAVGSTWRHLRSLCPSLWVTPVLLFVICSLKTGYTDNLRYLVPSYPFIFVWSAAVLMHMCPKRARQREVMCWLLIGLSSCSIGSQYPMLLGYFNELVGGGQNGWSYLSGSNVDWGQDLLFLRKWLKEHQQDRPVAVYFNQDVGIDYWIYLGQKFERPTESMHGYAVVDSYAVTGEYKWLWRHSLVDRVGTSLFVFRVGE